MPIRPTTYRAPSWSWASIDGAIISSYLHRTQQFDTILVDVVTSLVAGPFGPVQDGHLILRGRLIPITLRDSFGNGHVGEICINNAVFCNYGFLDDVRQQFSVRMDDATKHSKWSERSPVFLAAFDEHQFLILERTGKAKGEFRRIGILSITNSTGIHMLLKDLCMEAVSQLDPKNFGDAESCYSPRSVRYREERRIAQTLPSQPSEGYDENMGNCDARDKQALDKLNAYLSSVPGCRMLRRLKEEDHLEADLYSGYYTYRVV